MKHLKGIVLGMLLCLFFLAVIFTPSPAQKTTDPQLGKAPIKDVVAAMTLEEKAGLVVGVGMRRPAGAPTAQGATGVPGVKPAQTPPPLLAPPVAQTPRVAQPAGQTAAPSAAQSRALVPGAAGMTFALARLGITPMAMADGPAGLRISPTRENDKKTYYCTGFPIATMLASTWDTDLVTKVGQAVGNEILEYGVDIWLAPALNLHRNPLCGRNFEYYSEDPLVTGKMTAAMVKGVQSQGVGTSIKHYAANNAETNRNSLNTIVSARALREMYLEGFRIAVQEAQPWTVMSSYNLINGLYASENPDLLTNVLRKDWGFKGFVMTDWGGGRDPVAQMTAGNELLMPGSPNQIQAIVKAVQDGKLDVKVLDRNVERILAVLMRSPRFKGFKYSDKPDLQAHAALARQAAAEGMVLLKNANAALPLDPKVKKIAAFGNGSYALIAGGTGSGDVNKAYVISLADGLKSAGYAVHEDLQMIYQAYAKAIRESRPQQQGRGFMGGQRTVGEMMVNAELIEGMSNAADAAIITITRNSGEGRDRTNDEGDFKLNAAERDLVKLVSAAFQAKGKKTVVVLNVGGVVEVASWRDQPDAILLAWQPGQEAGHAVADVVTGKINPSGKLATTFPVKYEDVPSFETFPGKELPVEPSAQAKAGQGQTSGFGRGRPAVVYYEDGIYVGYRYYESFGLKPAYEFGYGLSYTNFSYEKLKLSSTSFKDKLTATVEIKNTGAVAGKEAVGLYLTAPSAKLEKPAVELKAFGKTKLLQPGDSQTLTFVLDARGLASFDPALSAWVAEAGNYEVKIGASSRDIKQTASFTLGKDIVVKKESASLLPKEKITEKTRRAVQPK